MGGQIDPTMQTISNELGVANGLLLRGSRLVIPPNLRSDILNKIHMGHQGITKCRRRAAQARPCKRYRRQDV